MRLITRPLAGTPIYVSFVFFHHFAISCRSYSYTAACFYSRVMLEHAQSDKLRTNLTRSESTASTQVLENSSQTSLTNQQSSSADSTLEADESDPELTSKLVSIVSDQVGIITNSYPVYVSNPCNALISMFSFR